MSEKLSLYDRNFTGWLEKRTLRMRPAKSVAQGPGLVPKRYTKVDVNQLLRCTLDPRGLAQLDALKFAR